MITKIETPKEILGFEITGKLKIEDFNKMEPLMDKYQKEYDGLKLLIIYNDFEWPTIEALKEDLKSYFEYDITKIAFVSKTKWLREAADSVAELMPGDMKAKGFKPEEKDEAIAWLVA
jgi:hypothetical protein